MELAFVIWAVGTLPTIASGMCFLLFIVSAISFAAYVGCKIRSNLETGEDDIRTLKSLSKLGRNILIPSSILWFAFLLVPDKTTSYQMLAAYGIQKVVENPEAQQLASDGVNILKALMSKAKKELEEKK